MNRAERRATEVRRKTRPTMTIEAAAELVHNTIVSTIGEDRASRKCGWYAFGMFLLLREPWTIQSGSAFVSTGVDDHAVGYDVEAARVDGLEGREFHCWLARPVGEVSNDSARDAIIVDASARHFETLSRRLSVPWDRKLPAVVHGSWRALYQDGIQYRGDMVATMRAQKELADDVETRAFSLALARAHASRCRRAAAERDPGTSPELGEEIAGGAVEDAREPAERRI